MSKPATDFHSLSIAERVQLVEDIWDSIAAEAPESVTLSVEQQEEIRRRVAAHDADSTSAVEWETLRGELMKSDR